MSNRPGGALARRPLHFYWIVDCSASMGLEGKMSALNTAVREALPQMREVQHQNPTAAVYVRTMRFSSEAAWLQSEPISLSNFQWADLAADVLPQTAEFSAEFRNRLQREGAQTGDVQIALMWHNYNDLDLHVICPSGEEIFFGNRNSRCGGELDVDMNVSPTSTTPVENVYWPSGRAPKGQYQVYVDHFNNHELSGCRDPTSYRVALKFGGAVLDLSGSISYGQNRHVHTFEVTDQVVSSTSGGGNTSIGKALNLVAAQLQVPPMTDRALPPVLVLLSDGQPTDDFMAGLQALMASPWGKKTVRIAIAIGQDVDMDVLQQFIGNSELRPLQATNPEQLVNYIKWTSTAVLQANAAPPSQALGTSDRAHVPLPALPIAGPSSADDPW